MDGLRKRCIEANIEKTMDAVTDAFSKDPFIKTAAQKLGNDQTRTPYKFIRNHVGAIVIEFYVLDEEFEDWLLWHGDAITCQFSPRKKAHTLTRPRQEGLQSHAHRCHKRGDPPKKPEYTKNTRMSKRVRCKSSISSLSKPLETVGEDKLIFRRVRYNFKHNHSLGDAKNLREMRKSELLTKKIRVLIERGKTIREVQDELAKWKTEFLARDGAQHLRRDDFVTYSDVYHIYHKLLTTKFQKHKEEFKSCQLWMNDLHVQGYFTYNRRDGSCYGFSSQWQMEQLETFGEVICFDGTHQTGG